MTLVEALLFVPLAVLANTALPISFDPILLAFAGRHAGEGWRFAALGSVCAGIGAVVDAVLIARLLPVRCRAPKARRRFYVRALLIAMTIIPFTTVRLGLLRARPHPLVFGIAVAAGRLPRYLLTVSLWQLAAPPAWVTAALALVVVAALVQPLRTKRIFEVLAPR